MIKKISYKKKTVEILTHALFIKNFDQHPKDFVWSIKKFKEFIYELPYISFHLYYYHVETWLIKYMKS
jgi:hypothetical protein